MRPLTRAEALQSPLTLLLRELAEALAQGAAPLRRQLPEALQPVAQRLLLVR